MAQCDRLFQDHMTLGWLGEAYVYVATVVTAIYSKRLMGFVWHDQLILHSTYIWN